MTASIAERLDQCALDALIEGLRQSAAFASKQDIAGVLDQFNDTSLGALPRQAIANGDDCAALDDGQGGYLLFAIEGLIDTFVEAEPWFAGYCSVMVNVSDVYAMGGRPLALVDALWSASAHAAKAMLQGMRTAAERYGVAVVGGHTNQRAARAGLAVAILGRAQALLAASAARPGDRLIMVVDLRGHYMEPNAFWNASTEAPPERLRDDLEVLAQLAEAGLCQAAKDISMAGPLGSTLMLLEAAGLGARIDLKALPKAAGVPLARWLRTFPSYGFVLAAAQAHVQAIVERFAARDLAVAVIGELDAGARVNVFSDQFSTLLWDFSVARFTGAGTSRVNAPADPPTARARALASERL